MTAKSWSQSSNVRPWVIAFDEGGGSQIQSNSTQSKSLGMLGSEKESRAGLLERSKDLSTGEISAMKPKAANSCKTAAL
jgi:hypothetical protein